MRKKEKKTMKVLSIFLCKSAVFRKKTKLGLSLGRADPNYDLSSFLKVKYIKQLTIVNFK